MITFEIYTENFMILFGSYLTFFAVVYGIKKSINLITDRLS